MITHPVGLGSSPEAAAMPLRLPGTHATDLAGTAPPDTGTRVKAPLPPRISYDPSKLRENLQQAIEHLNKQLASSGRSLGFSMDEVIDVPVVTVRSTQTGEVIRQIPSEAVVRVAHTLDELKGLLHDALT